MSRILVTGATGQLGSGVINALTEKGIKNVSGLVRDLSKAEGLTQQGVQPVHGNYDDYQSLVNAFKEINVLYFISGSDIVARRAQHENIVKAALEAGVDHVIYTSFQRRSEDGTSPVSLVSSTHILTEKLLKESGLVYTIMKHTLYSDMLPFFMGDKVIDEGIIFLPAGKGKSAYASRSDMALAGASVITGQGHENKTYEISAGESYSFYEIAEMLSDLSGKPIHYTEPDAASYTKAMEEAGVPADAIKGLTSFTQAIAKGEFDFPSDTLEHLIGRKPMSIKQILKNAYKL